MIKGGGMVGIPPVSLLLVGSTSPHDNALQHVIMQQVVPYMDTDHLAKLTWQTFPGLLQPLFHL